MSDNEQKRMADDSETIPSRINEGYVITDSIHVGETEFVLGKLDSNIPMYVTWACKGGDNYYWGHYFNDPLDAKKDLLVRANEELEFQMERRASVSEKLPKKPEKERGHGR